MSSNDTKPHHTHPSSHEVRNAFVVASVTILFILLFILLPRYLFISKHKHYLDKVDEWLCSVERELEEEDKFTS